jgi:ATP-binding cassette subfamily B multidrug efflux pump
MLLRLVRTYLKPYAAPLAAVVALQFVGTMAALYLPTLNADIIDTAWSPATPPTSCATAG